MPAARLMIDPPQQGAWNMAVDEALLESAAEGITTLRFYQWSEPTLSLGYFQPLADREQHLASRKCPLVRRASGGGAILHDRELTYSFAAPVEQRFAAHIERLYYAFHETLLATLAEWDIQAELCAGPPAGQKPRSSEPFLCFQRRSAGDVLYRGSKICGSAQRRHRGAVLQHGSILLDCSPGAPELAGVLQLAGKTPTASNLAHAWRPRLEKQLLLAFEPASLAAVEERRAIKNQDERFAAAAWSQRR